MAYEAPYYQQYPLPANAGNSSVPASNAPASVTLKAAGANTANVLCGLEWSVSAAPSTTTTLTVTDNGVTIFVIYVAQGGPGSRSFDYPIVGQANAPMVVTLSAAGTGILGTLQVLAKTLYVPPGPAPSGLNYFGGTASNPPLWPPLIYA